jgi:hypothetical protein
VVDRHSVPVPPLMPTGETSIYVGVATDRMRQPKVGEPPDYPRVLVGKITVAR